MVDNQPETARNVSGPSIVVPLSDLCEPLERTVEHLAVVLAEASPLLWLSEVESRKLAVAAINGLRDMEGDRG